MNDLVLFDVSPFIHAGHINKYSMLSRVQGDAVRCYTYTTPTGGTSLIFNTLHSLIGKCDIAFCCDRNPVIKKEMIPGYKSDRAHSREIEVEKAAAEYILRECGGTVLAYSGYEADDIIYSLVKKYHDFYDHIYIYTSDSDLYFLVDDIVSIRPSSSKAKTVTMQNYETENGAKYLYNTSTLVKIVYGDATDNIPALDTALQDKVVNAFITAKSLHRCGDKKYLMGMANLLFPEIIPQINNVFPLEVEDLPNTFNELDKQMLINFGNAINNKYFRTYPASPDFNIDEHIEKMHSMGYYIEEESY